MIEQGDILDRKLLLTAQLVRIGAVLVARRYATELCEMAEARHYGDTELYRACRARARTATQIADRIAALAV